MKLLAHGASHGTLRSLCSLSLAYLFLPGLGASYCTLCSYFLNWRVLWAHCVIIRLFLCSLLMVFLSSIWHRHPVCLWVLFLSCCLVLLLFSLVWWLCTLILVFQIKYVTPFIPPLGFDPRVLVWENHLGLGFESYLLDYASVVFNLLGLQLHKK